MLGELKLRGLSNILDNTSVSMRKSTLATCSMPTIAPDAAIVKSMRRSMPNAIERQTVASNGNG